MLIPSQRVMTREDLAFLFIPFKQAKFCESGKSVTVFYGGGSNTT